MYLQITTVCNMSCLHCCMSCAENKRGEFMSMDTFYRAMDVVSDYTCALGGGEPSLHPKLFEMIGHILCNEDASLFIATNGKKTNVARALFGLSNNNPQFDVELSIDDFHEAIDPRIVDLYTNAEKIRTVTKILPTGHAVENGVNTTSSGCACPELIIKPNGDVKTCCCDDAVTLCNVHDANARDIISEYNSMLADINADYCIHDILDAIERIDEDDDLCPETMEMANLIKARHAEISDIPVRMCA